MVVHVVVRGETIKVYRDPVEAAREAARHQIKVVPCIVRDARKSAVKTPKKYRTVVIK